MKKLLITGAGSYVGQSVESHLKGFPGQYTVDSLDMIGDGWRERSFRGYDAVLHVAGIVHQADSKDDPAQRELYDRVNTRLAIETAQKAKAEGVGQFIFMSSASVYGLSAPIGQVVTITRETPLNPVDNYGISKRNAELGLAELAGDGFKLAVLRPPMIYGKGCKGNYVTLSRLAKKLPVFPWVENQRSMLYAENLAEFVRCILDDGAEGVFCPQDPEYVNTCEMVSLIAHFSGKHILMIHGLTWALKLLRPFTSAVDKAFGSLCYDRELSDYPKNYQIKTLQEAVAATEGE